MPGTAPIRAITPHQPVRATVNTLTGGAELHAHATSETEHFTYIVWSDDSGEIYGT